MNVIMLFIATYSRKGRARIDVIISNTPPERLSTRGAVPGTMTKSKTKDLTPTQYAKLRDISLSAVTEAVRRGWQMPGVVKVKKFGRFYLLKVDTNKLNTNIKRHPEA